MKGRHAISATVCSSYFSRLGSRVTTKGEMVFGQAGFLEHRIDVDAVAGQQGADARQTVLLLTVRSRLCGKPSTWEIAFLRNARSSKLILFGAWL
jgi:hypothetical protein